MTIEAVATDTGGQTASHSITLTVEEVQEPAISLSVTAYKVRGAKYADLCWSGATSTNVDIYRDGVVVATTPSPRRHARQRRTELVSMRADSSLKPYSPWGIPLVRVRYDADPST